MQSATAGLCDEHPTFQRRGPYPGIHALCFWTSGNKKNFWNMVLDKLYGNNFVFFE